jgi:hypothetical protein
MSEVASDFIKAEYPIPIPIPTPTPTPTPTPNFIYARGKFPNNPNFKNARICKNICGSVNNCQEYQNYIFGINK